MFSRDEKLKADRLRYLEYIAYHDNLTGLKNRMYLYDKLVKEDYRFIYFIDIDDLRDINKEHGHLYGDTYIKSVVDEICGRIGSKDVLIRYGGDEFLLFSKELVDLKGGGSFSAGCSILDGVTLNDAVNYANLDMLEKKKLK